MQIEVNGKSCEAKVLFSADDIRARVQQLANEINADYGIEDTLVILIVLHGALIFASDLVRNLAMPTEIETIRIKSYVGTESSGNVQLVTPLPRDLANKHILVIEDIVDTGRSLHFLLKELGHVHAKSVKVCSLLNKASAHQFEIDADYIGFDIGKNFVVGYGLDLDGKYRNLPFIADIL